MKNQRHLLALVLILLLSACATVPTAPSVMALPGTDRSFDQFMVDDSGCRQFASRQVGVAKEGDDSAAIKTATIATVIGAVAGAAIGGRDGAAVGAGMGLIAGSAMGSEQGRSANYGTQRQYDQAYVQCMYGRGHKVPVQGVMTERPLSTSTTNRNTLPPPPPPGMPPPPPPR